ncbi:MAG: hypothetical protein GZ091_12905 [Paludibacter sp.]|nr:hypothetical protein [Paludibacter sp.]
MKKILLLFVLLGQIAFAQQVIVQSVTSLKNTENGGFYYSKFSSTNDYLLATSENYAGLKLYSFSDNSIKTITQDAGAGYGVQTSADGNTIVYKKNEFVKNLKNTSLVSYSKTSGKKIQLVAPTRESITAKFAANKPQYVKGKMLVAKDITTIESTPVICIEDQKMVIYSGNIRKVLTPNGQNASYIWPSISPDRKNIAYTVAGKGTFVCSIAGSNPISLGKLNAPVWLNNQWLVGMDDKDDGEKLISSSLVALSINGKVRQTLPTPANQMAMYPAASTDGSRIAFNTEKGELYLLNVQVK